MNTILCYFVIPNLLLFKPSNPKIHWSTFYHQQLILWIIVAYLTLEKINSILLLLMTNYLRNLKYAWSIFKNHFFFLLILGIRHFGWRLKVLKVFLCFLSMIVTLLIYIFCNVQLIIIFQTFWWSLLQWAVILIYLRISVVDSKHLIGHIIFSKLTTLCTKGWNTHRIATHYARVLSTHAILAFIAGSSKALCKLMRTHSSWNLLLAIVIIWRIVLLISWLLAAGKLFWLLMIVISHVVVMAAAFTVFVVGVGLTVKRTLIHSLIQISFLEILWLLINFIIIFSHSLLFVSVFLASVALADFIVKTLLVVEVAFGILVVILVLRVGFFTNLIIFIVVRTICVVFSFFILRIASFLGWNIISHLWVIVVKIIFVLIILRV